MRCPNCNFPVLPKFDECPKCHTPLKESQSATSFDFDSKPQKAASFDFDAPASEVAVVKEVVIEEEEPKSALDVISGKIVWGIAPGQIARKITPEEIARYDAVKGVVVEDGVTAAVFVDGREVFALEGGIYRFGNEPTKINGRQAVITPRGKTEILPPQKGKDSEGGLFGFVKKLFGAKKQEKPKAKAPRPGSDGRSEPKPAPKPKPSPSILREKSVVTVYLISNRVFELAFGSQSGENYRPFTVKAGIHDVEIGVALQACVSDNTQFRQNYLADKTSVTLSSLTDMMRPWVEQILVHSLKKVDVSNGLSEQDRNDISEKLGEMLQSRLFGISILNVFDLSTEGGDLEKLRNRERELWMAEKEGESDIRMAEFRNRLTARERQLELDETTSLNAHELAMQRSESEFKRELAALNQDNLLTEDEFNRFLEVHEMEIRLRKAALNADEQVRGYETEKVLAELANKKLIDDDALAIVREQVENGAFERARLNDVLRQKALTKSAMEKLRLESELAVSQKEADRVQTRLEREDQLEEADFEVLLYGKKYAARKQETADTLELESLALDAQIAMRRKEDAYSDERYDIDRRRETDEWEEEFRREGKKLDRSREDRRKDAEFDFDMQVKKETFDFDMTARKAQFDFDLEEKRNMADTERSIRLDAHAQDMADREHQRAMEDKRLEQEALRMKGDIAFRNMQAMMDAKRAARKDELEAEVDKLNIKSQMTAEQIASEQLAGLDAEAQKAYMEALREKNSSTHENDALRREMEARREMQEQSRNDMKEMMAQMMAMTQQQSQQFADMARHSMDTTADIAKARAASDAGAAERRAQDLERDNVRYRQDAMHAQGRLDQTASRSMDYVTRQNISENQTARQPEAAKAQEAPETVRLNTSWLREHGYSGSFNELAGMLNSMGGQISQDFDEGGNPVIVVDDLTTGQVMKVLQDCGISF